MNASLLPEWPNNGGVVDHYIEGYGYGFWTDHNVYATNKIYYADTASPSDYGTAGDDSMTYDNFYNGPWSTGPEAIVV